MKLDIIVPRYREPWELCQYLFQTIATQRGISFDNVHVIVVNDGEENVLDGSVFDGLPYSVEYLIKPHGGVSAARNYGRDHSEADYVMFCDADDGFLSNYALHLIFSAMQEGFDFLCGNFVEETFTENNAMTIIRHDRDMTFMHGKVYRRDFLNEKNIRFDPAMTLHEDGYFNAVAYAVASHEGTVKFIETPIYLWRWNDNSTVRSNRQDFVLRTYGHVMQTRHGICEEFKRRGYDDDYETAVCMTVLNSYYDFQKTSYYKPENRRYLQDAEKAFRAFYMKYRNVVKNCTNLKVAEIAVKARENACNSGMLLEREDLASFLKRIEYSVKS